MTPPASVAGSRPSALYQFGLILAGAAMVILPCIYVALTALAAVKNPAGAFTGEVTAMLLVACALT